MVGSKFVKCLMTFTGCARRG